MLPVSRDCVVRLEMDGNLLLNSLSSKKSTASSPNGTYSVKISWNLSLVRERYTPPPKPSAERIRTVEKNLRKKRLLRGGGVGVAELGGGGGVNGTLFAGILADAGVAGVEAAVIEEEDVSATGPGGRGSDVASLAEPGRTADFESAILGLSARNLCRFQLAIRHG